ncbi:putative sulfonate ABC transporter periplasmic substrate-binding protein [Halosimplex carlsbadense 2-9-1]|uniref:Putative sulfonate ABC transporter periplasmic substrate-binding protein n=2 Tax=Halosimplex carlsbadense TaxID=171164 RepID=M0CGT9_9EURY|nr:putative sulfonate ABC transporter periplasmic substrate-binding protein [Halosimplex carlsbadense 2-9-1]
MMQYFVIDQQGWYDDLEPDIEVQTFGGGPPLVQAYASGNIDFAYVGISPGLVAIANGVSSKVVAANVLEPNVMVGSSEFRSYWVEHGPDAFEQFRSDKGRKPRFATLPAGSTPDVFLRYWITEVLGLDLDVIEIVGQSPSALQSTLSSGNADAGSAIEPVPTILQENPDTDMKPFIYAGEIMPGQPGAVLQPSQSLVDDNPDLIQELVDIHVRATGFIHENRSRAAEMASEVIGSDILSADVATKAINTPASNFISNPRRIVEKSLVYNDFHQQLGSVDTDLSESDVFDHSFYEEASGGGQ